MYVCMRKFITREFFQPEQSKQSRVTDLSFFCHAHSYLRQIRKLAVYRVRHKNNT